MYALTNKDVYKEQIQVTLETGNGYANIRKYLFDDLDILSQQQLIMFFHDIFLDLQTYLLKEGYNYCVRALDIIEDLLKNYEPEFSRAVNDSGMALSLQTAATYRRLVTLHRDEWNQFQMRVRGLFLFWFNKYQYQERKYQKLIRYYRQMKQKGLQFPVQSLEISPRTRKKKIQKQTFKQDNKIILSVALAEILPIIEQAQNNLQHNPERLIDKQYVRLLKAKNKYLYQLSTGDTSSFTKQDKQNISLYYKRIRSVLKKIDSMNEQIVKKHKILKEQEYIKEKVQGFSQKKIQSAKKIIQNCPTDLLDITASQNSLIDGQVFRIEQKQIIIQPTQQHSQIQKISADSDLISIIPNAELDLLQINEEPQKKNYDQMDLFKSAQKIVHQALSTPTKKQPVQQDEFSDYLQTSHDKLKQDQQFKAQYTHKSSQSFNEEKNQQNIFFEMSNSKQSQSSESQPDLQGKKLQFSQTPKKSIKSNNEESPNKLAHDNDLI